MTDKRTPKIFEPCAHFSVQDYARYVALEMSGPDAEFFLSHAEDCSSCFNGIREATELWQRQKDTAENELLHASALSIMDRIDQSIFSIVISAVQGVVKLIRSTGEQLSMAPALTGVRSVSGESTADTVQPLRLVKEFEDSCFSVEVTISPVEPDMLDLIVSLLDRQQEAFIVGVDVTFLGESVQLNDITDENGQVVFKVPASGFYELAMKKNGTLLGTMTLTGL